MYKGREVTLMNRIADLQELLRQLASLSYFVLHYKISYIC
jgi:hypothetical protein